MVAKQLTKEDLLQFKIDFSKEIQEERHAFRNEIGKKLFVIDDMAKDYQSMKTEMEYIKKELGEIKTMIKEQFWNFATKEEHEQNKEAITEIQETHKWIIRSLLWAFWSLILWLVYLFLKKIWITL